MPTRHRAQKHTYLGLEYEKSGNQVPLSTVLPTVLPIVLPVELRALVHPPSQTKPSQAGPGPGPLAPQAKTIGNTIGNTVVK